MAVVKVSFTRSRGAAKAYVKYITHRPGKDGERTRRKLFDLEGQLTKRQAYKMINQGGRRTVFYRIVISPDPKGEDTLKDLDLREMTEQTMMQLQDRLKGTTIQFLAAIHADHTTKRHIHVLALVPGRLRREDLDALRTAATDAALAQRQDRDQHLDHTRVPKARQRPTRRLSRSLAWQQDRPSKPLRAPPACPNCGPGSEMDRRGRFYECAICGLCVTRSVHQGLGSEQEGGLGVSHGEGGSP
jgi:hypothetical protein